MGIFSYVGFKLRDWWRERHHEPDKDRIEASRLRAIVHKILQRMNLHLVQAQRMSKSGATRLVAVGKGAYRDTKHVIYLAPEPRNDVVKPRVVRALVDEVQRCGATTGMLVTPYHIDRGLHGKVSERIQLIDGLALKRLVSHHLPHLEDEVAGYRLVGSVPAPANAPTAWTQAA